MRDWTKPQRQSFAAVGILMFQLARKAINFWLAVGAISLFRNKGKMLPYLGFFLATMLLYIFLKALLEFLFFRMYLEGDNLIIRKGIFQKSTLTIPLEKIQGVHLQQNFWNILTSTVGVSIDTPGTEKAEVSIKALKQSEAEELRIILIKERIAEGGTEKSSGILLQLTLRNLLRLSLTVNHLKTLLIIIGFLLSAWAQLEEIADMKSYDKLDEMSQDMSPDPAAFAGLGLLLLAFSILVSGIRTIFRYYSLQVKVDAGGFTVNWGLVQIRQHIIPFRKIQMIIWQTNFIRRWMGIFQVEIKSAGEGIFTKKERVLIPTMNRDQTHDIIRYYQKESPATNGHPAGIHSAYYRRKWLMVCLPLAITSLSTAWGLKEPRILFSLLLPAYLLVSYYLYQKNFRYWLNERGIQMHESIWGRKYSLINWEHIQFVRRSQSIYQRRAGYANVIFYTAAGSFRIPYLPIEEANRLINLGIYQVEKEGKGWI